MRSGAAVRGALACGANVIAVDVSLDKRELAAQLGATIVIDAGTLDAVERVRALTAGEWTSLSNSLASRAPWRAPTQ